MSNYKIKIRIEIEKTGSPVSDTAVQADDGSFSTAVSKKSAESIDKCGKALLGTCYPAVREALSHHMSRISRREADCYGQGVLKKREFISG